MKKHDELPTEHDDALIAFLHKAIKFAVKILAIFMVLVIFWGVADVIYVLYKQLMEPPFLLLDISDILKTFAAFLAVLIATDLNNFSSSPRLNWCSVTILLINLSTLAVFFISACTTEAINVDKKNNEATNSLSIILKMLF